jgi:hypothetical protein
MLVAYCFPCHHMYNSLRVEPTLLNLALKPRVSNVSIQFKGIIQLISAARTIMLEFLLNDHQLLKIDSVS